MSAHFRVETSSELAPEVLFRCSLSIGDHRASMAASGEQVAVGWTVVRVYLGAYMRRLIIQRNEYLCGPS